ncbi:MAG: 16S rRNA (cytidine(1402)-2'-O)-methyltransferase [Lachnospiraceae bacterium]|nr:16S rRNA (cytidine(1402)-2'-O)-methyltransferase [Lachnospiraceae bacterium]
MDEIKQKAGTLYLCATPIGNLEDITLRVLRTLKEVDLIAAEDTRNTIRLLNHYDIHTPLTSYHEYNRFDKAAFLVEEMRAGKNIAAVTDAGTPGISDPGEELARQALAAGLTVTSLPGACACVTALTISGLPTRRFSFEAFLPTDKKERQQILKELEAETRTMLIYEAPHHLAATLKELAEHLGEDRPCSLVRELTKLHEEVFQTTLGGAFKRCEETPPRGEYVIAIEGRSLKAAAEEEQKKWDDMPMEEHMAMYTAKGMDKKEAMKAVAKDRGISKRDVYAALL